MTLPDNPRDLSRLLVAVTDLHPGWKLTEQASDLIRGRRTPEAR